MKKRFLTLALAAVMAFSMSMTALAVEGTTEVPETGATITVTNLTNREATVVKAYKLVSFDNVNGWVVEDTYKDLITDVADLDTYELDELKSAALGVEADATVKSNGGENVYFTDLEIGSYLIVAQAVTEENGKPYVVYNTMIATTYGNEADDVASPVSATVVAKAATSKTEKEINNAEADTFVANDATVSFTIKTTMPYFAADNGNSFVLYEKPENLKNLSIESAYIGEKNDANKVSVALSTPSEDGTYTIDLSSYASKANAGKTVEIVVAATVDLDNGYVVTGDNAFAYKNSAWTNKDSEDDNHTTVTGYTGSFNLLKTNDKNEDEEGYTTLAGAEFNVKSGENVLTFKKLSDGVYVFDADVTNTTLAVDKNGSLKVEGLDEGTYKIVETKAPTGYAINTKINDVTIVKDDNANVDVAAAQVKDSVLSQLPFTGGMGTTIFTVLGVVMMVAAAALYFATKKKATK